jgi:hypothetical protein
MSDVPELGRPIRLRGLKASVVLEEFAPTRFDAWYGTAYLGDTRVPCVVVRHGGDVARRGLLGIRTAVPDPPGPDAVLGIVVEPSGASAVWVHGDKAGIARELSRADWRAFGPIG